MALSKCRGRPACLPRFWKQGRRWPMGGDLGSWESGAERWAWGGHERRSWAWEMSTEHWALGAEKREGQRFMIRFPPTM
ncbi:MAG: hypothetical protein WD098_12160 [Balneolales bacterium]